MIKDLGTWENTQARKDAQISNPATPITPTNTDIATQPTDRVITADPSNGGVVRQYETPLEGKPDISALNRALFIAGFGGNKSTKLGDAYGIGSNGLDKEQFEGITQVQVEDGVMYEKQYKKVADSMSDKQKTTFIQDINGIDISRKQPNSGADIHPDTGGKFEMTTSLAESFKVNPQIINNKELIQNGSIAAFKSAYEKFDQEWRAAAKLDPVARTGAIQASLGDLKISLIPLVEKTKDIIFREGGGGSSTAYTTMDEYSKDLRRYEKLYKASSDEIQNTIQAYSRQDSKYKAQMVEVNWASPSINAKKKLNENKAYQIFLETMEELNPQYRDIIKGFRQSEGLGVDEKEFIKQHFEKGMFKSLFEARAQAAKDFGPSAYANFNQWQDIIDVSKLSKQKRKDDFIEDMKHVEIDPNQLMFYINKGY